MQIGIQSQNLNRLYFNVQLHKKRVEVFWNVQIHVVPFDSVGLESLVLGALVKFAEFFLTRSFTSMKDRSMKLAKPSLLLLQRQIDTSSPRRYLFWEIFPGFSNNPIIDLHIPSFRKLYSCYIRQ